MSVLLTAVAAGLRTEPSMSWVLCRCAALDMSLQYFKIEMYQLLVAGSGEGTAVKVARSP